MAIAGLDGLHIAMTILTFVFGCIIGSFINVCIWRLPRALSVGHPRRSFCPSCGEPIHWHDNVPLVSFFILGGRCRRCGRPVSWRYPVVEGLTGLLFALIYFRQSALVGTDPGQVVVMMLVTGLLVFASAVDLEFFIIPDEATVFGVIGGLLAGFLLPQLHVGSHTYQTFEGLTGNLHLDGLIASGIGAAASGGMVLFFGLLGSVLFRREALGFGDVKLMAMLGAFFGWKVALITFFLAPFLGLMYGLPLLFARGEHVMPYGPFLSMGGFLALVFRDELCYYAEMLEDMARMIVS